MGRVQIEDPLISSFEEWESNGISPFFPVIEENDGNRVITDGSGPALMFGSCDYLGLSQDRDVAEASVDAIRRFGTHTYGAQALCGHTVLHEAIEKHLARIYNRDSALIFPSGMAANQAVLSSLAGPDDVVINDRLNHVSIFMGARLFGAEVRFYPHNNMTRLEQLLTGSCDKPRRIIVTDGLFSADGDFAHLDAITVLARKFDAIVVVDEAHSFGCVGQNGLGVAEHLGVHDRVDVIVGTMSKAVGSVGGFVVSDRSVNLLLRTSAPSYTSSRGSTPATAAATLRSLQKIEEEGQHLREILTANFEYLSGVLRENNFDLLDTTSHIVPVLIGEETLTARVARWLTDRGLFTAAFMAPSVPRMKARLRIGVTARHCRAELDELVDALLAARRKFAF